MKFVNITPVVQKYIHCAESLKFESEKFYRARWEKRSSLFFQSFSFEQLERKRGRNEQYSGKDTAGRSQLHAYVHSALACWGPTDIHLSLNEMRCHGMTALQDDDVRALKVMEEGTAAPSSSQKCYVAQFLELQSEILIAQ